MTDKQKLKDANTRIIKHQVLLRKIKNVLDDNELSESGMLYQVRKLVEGGVVG